MICDIVGTKELFNDSLNRAEKLRKVMRFTKEGEDLENTISTLKKSLSLIDEKKFSELDEMAKKEFKSDIATITTLSQLGGEFQASVRRSTTGKGRLSPFVFKSAKYRQVDNVGDILDVVAVDKDTGKWSTFSFVNGSSISRVSASNSSRMHIPQFDMVFNKVIGTIKGVESELTRKTRAKSYRKNIQKLRDVVDRAKSTEELLGSASNFSVDDFNYKRASLKDKYVHGDVDHMKNILADLHALGGKESTEEQLEHYDELLDAMHPKFFRDMNLYIDSNSEDANGWVVLDTETDKNKILINATSNTSAGMSNAEVYMHEVVHTMTSWAIRNKSPYAIRLKEKLRYLKEKAAQEITWQDLKNVDDSLSVKSAKEMYDYIFNSEHSDDEFVAFAVTNPALMTVLKKVKLKKEAPKGILNKVLGLFRDLINTVMGSYSFSNRGKSVSDEVHALAFAMAKINNKTEEEIKNTPELITKFDTIIDRAEGNIETFLSSVVSKFFDTKGSFKVPEKMNAVQKLLFYTKFFWKSVYNHDYRNEVGRYFSMFGLDGRSSVREIVRSVAPGVHDHLTTVPEFLGLKGSNVDLFRNNHVMYTLKSIVEGFKTTLVEEEEEALTAIIMESNASTLFTRDKNRGEGYTSSQIVKLLSDTGYRKRAIARLIKRIQKEDPKRANWIVGQAKGLGRLMVTGSGHKAQNSNSRNIVKGFLSSTRHEDSQTLLSLVEELASLSALDLNSPSNRKSVSDLLKSDESGVRNVVNIYEAFKKNSEDSLFKGDASHIIEGYVKELFSDDIETAYAVLSKREEMESKGFVLKSEYESNDVSGAEAIGFFASESYTRAEKLSGAVSLGSPGSRGLTLKEARYAQFHDSAKHAHVWFEADKARNNAEAVNINKMLSDGVPLDEIEEGPVPVLDAQGNAVDYRYMMSKRDKAKYLKQNRKITDVLSKTAGTVVDKAAREVQNKAVLDFIKGQVKDVYDNPKSKDNGVEHTLIGPDHEDPNIRKLYYQLPESYRDYASSRADKSLPVPDMLMDQYFGYSHFRFSDAPGVRNLPNAIKRILNLFEKVFIDVVKIAKGNILLKMPVVLIVNIISNLLYAVSTGTNPIELIAAYTNSVKDVHNFMQKHKEVEESRVELLALSREYSTRRFSSPEEVSEYNDEVKRLSDKIKRLEAYMEDSPIKELFDLGMYQAVIEDVNMYSLGDTNIVSDTVDKLTSKLPSLVKKGAQWAYLSKETSWYKTNQYILQMSDLVARDVMNRKQKLIEESQVKGERDLPLEYRKAIGRDKPADRRRKLGNAEKERFLAMAKESRHRNLLKSFVNYNLPNGKGEEYLNRIGVLMFTKYVKRIQNVITESGTKHPIRTAATLLGAGFALDLEMIQDQSFLLKAGDDYGLFGLTPIHNPVDVLMTVVNPPLINLYGTYAEGH